MNPKKSSDLFLLALILCALFFLYLISFRNGHYWGDDFSQYIAQAKSFVQGNIEDMLEKSRYRYENSENKIIGPVLYPWGYPLLLSPVYHVFGLNILVMKVFTSIFFLLSLTVIFFLFRGRTGRLHSYLIILMLGVNPIFFDAKDDILSDFPFLFFTLLAVFMIQRFLIDKKPLLHDSVSNALIGATIFAASAIRVNGVLLLPLLFMVQLVEGIRSYRFYRVLTWRKLTYLTPYIVFLLCMIWFSSYLPAESSYSDQLGGLSLSSILRNMVLYAAMPVDFFIKSMDSHLAVIGKILFIISLPAVCLGLVVKGRENYHFFIFSALTMALFIFWPGVQGLRYIFPVIPFYLFFVLEGLSAIAPPFRMPLTGSSFRLNPAVAFAFTALFIFEAAISAETRDILKNPGNVVEGPFTRGSLELFDYIADHTRDSDVIVFFKPRAMSLLADRRSIRLSSLSDVMFSRAKYIACRKNDPLDLALQNNHAVARRIFSNKAYNLYARMQIVSEIAAVKPATENVRTLPQEVQERNQHKSSQKKTKAKKVSVKNKNKKAVKKHADLFFWMS